MLKRVAPALSLVAACWIVFLVNALCFHSGLNQFGIIPRHVQGLIGILWSPFLHGSLAHLLANTFPLLLFGCILCLRSRTEFSVVTAGGILLGGLLTWAIARPACHIGASGLVFCYFGYLASLALFRRTIGTFLLSVIVLIGFWGMLRGLVPTSAAISWEGHVAGLVAGIVLAKSAGAAGGRKAA